ncbi:hypothetical protein ACFQO1_11405 [Jejudonia soesokkakensis]|uniref:Lipocalin-like domain-containing protein n=1 Tax=Jejudonia soesokkakensis TaxID=1323432 RepID=A0ABW2MTN7_9FLAO
MKNLCIAIAVLFLVSCSGDDDTNTTNYLQFESIESDILAGTWQVNNYTDEEGNRTDLFESFVFTFQASGTVVAQNDILSQPGDWLYDTSSDVEEFELDFGMQQPFGRLSEDWEIVSASATQVVLTDVEGNETKNLTFIKI